MQVIGAPGPCSGAPIELASTRAVKTSVFEGATVPTVQELVVFGEARPLPFMPHAYTTPRAYATDRPALIADGRKGEFSGSVGHHDLPWPGGQGSYVTRL